MGNVRLYGSTSGYTELAPPAVAPNGVLSLPSGTGTIATQDYAAAAGGLVHIITTTFSAVSSVSLDNVFSSTYENYQVKLDFTGSVDATTDLRYRVGGVDNSDANSYKGQALRGSSTSATAFSNSGNIGTSAVSDGGTLRSVCTVEVFDPALAVTTFWMNTNRTRDDMIGIFTFRHTTATAFDGFTIIPASGTITGTIRVYGYANGA